MFAPMSQFTFLLLGSPLVHEGNSATLAPIVSHRGFTWVKLIGVNNGVLLHIDVSRGFLDYFNYTRAILALELTSRIAIYGHETTLANLKEQVITQIC